jgi:integrase
MGARKVKITDATIRALKPDPLGQAGQEIADMVVPGFRIRPNKSGHSYVWAGRVRGKPKPIRVTIGTVGQIGLAEARGRAREALALASEGRDPNAEAKAAKLAKEGRVTFGTVAEDYLKRHISKTRRAKDAEREIRTELMSRWADRALADVTRKDVVKMVDEILDRGATYQARNILGHLKSFYNWAIARGVYDIETSPCDRLRPKAVIGEIKARQRVLDDHELRAFWAATERMGYPYGPVFRLLALTGCRKSEIGEASWREIDLDSALLTIPPERFKTDITHIVPLSEDALAIITELPHWEEGDFVFSTRGGRIPVDGWTKAKANLDSLMSEELGHEVAPFVTHDIRRTVRTRLSSITTPEIAELVIGHSKKGMSKIYDQHTYAAEMRDALERWAARLRSIVTPPPENVTDIDEARRARA